MNEFTKVKIPNAFRNMTHSIEIGFMRKSPYNPKALAIISHDITFTTITVNSESENMLY